MTGRISRLLTDRRVGTKIMFAVLVVAAASVVDGLTAMNSLGSINQQVEAGYQHRLGLETLGDLRSAVNRSRLAIGDGLLATDGTGRSTASDARATAGQEASAEDRYLVGRVRASADVLVSASQSLSTVSIDLSISAEQTSRQVSTVSESAGRVSEGVQAVSAPPPPRSAPSSA
jgi:methyl-accepting chemotaxis protein